MRQLEYEWLPLFFEKELKSKPLKKILLDNKLVFVKLNNEIVCFENSCPHRKVPLDTGNIINNNLQCNYHGWEFSSKGKCENIVGCDNCNKSKINLKKYSINVFNGIVFIRLKGNKKFDSSFELFSNMDSIYEIKKLKSDYVHTIENFLDATHTPFIHKGLLRTDGKQEMDILLKCEKEKVLVKYFLKNKQNGIINKLFDSGIDENIVTFEKNGMATIKYLKKNKLIFMVSIHFIPLKKGLVQMFVNVSIKKTIIPSFIKFILLKPFMELAFYQDKKILEIQYLHNKNNENYKIVKSDIIINSLLYLLNLKKEKPKDLKLKINL